MEYEYNERGVNWFLTSKYPESQNTHYLFHISNGMPINHGIYFHSFVDDAFYDKAEFDYWCFVEYEDDKLLKFKRLYILESSDSEILDIANLVYLESAGKFTPEYMAKYILKHSRGKLFINYKAPGQTHYKFQAKLYNDHGSMKLLHKTYKNPYATRVFIGKDCTQKKDGIQEKILCIRLGKSDYEREESVYIQSGPLFNFKYYNNNNS